MQPTARHARGAGQAMGGLGKVFDVVGGLEADQIGGDQVADQGACLGDACQHVGGREGDVQEETDRAVTPRARSIAGIAIR